MKAVFLYFMFLCEHNRSNYLGQYAYYKNYFDRISADMAFLAKVNPRDKRPNYNSYYKEDFLKSLYNGITDSDAVIKRAHVIRNSNPLSHASAELIDKDSSSNDIKNIMNELEQLIYQYALDKKL